MKRFLSLLAAISIFIFSSKQHLACAEKEETTNFACAMQALESDNTRLPSAPVPIRNLEDGFNLYVANRTTEADRYMFLCVVNGKLLPFSLDGKNYTTTYEFEIGADEEILLPLKIRFSHLLHDDGNMLYLMIVGRLDDLARDARSIVHAGSTRVNIPLDVAEADSSQFIPSIAFESAENTIPSFMNSEFQWIHFRPTGSNQRLLSTHTLNDTQVLELELFLAACKYPMAVMFMLDHQPLPIDDKEMLCLKQGYDIYPYTLSIKLPPGEHQIYAHRFPLTTYKIPMTSSERITIIVPE